MIAAAPLLVLVAAVAPVPPRGMVAVQAAEWRSPVEKDAPPEQVAAFFLDETPVTNADFLAFVKSEPRWRRDRAPRLFAEEGYLRAWRAPLDPGDVDPRAPVTFVSWFAARAYCEARDKRLPTTAEWEVAAAGVDTAQVLAWYAQKTPARLPPVGGPKNAVGARDLHGLVWEWVEDFGSALVTADARSQNDGDDVRYCGGGAVNAADAADYASFMRFAFRGSLEANHTIAALGFRCARGQRGHR